MPAGVALETHRFYFRFVARRVYETARLTNSRFSTFDRADPAIGDGGSSFFFFSLFSRLRGGREQRATFEGAE